MNASLLTVQKRIKEAPEHEGKKEMLARGIRVRGVGALTGGRRRRTTRDPPEDYY